MLNFIFKCKDFLDYYLFANIVGLQNNNSIYVLKLRIIPFFIQKIICDFFNVNYFYQIQDNIYNSKKTSCKITPLIINFKIDDVEFTDIFNKYGNDIPFEFIFKYEEINGENIDITILKLGNMKKLNFKYKEIKQFSKSKLLFLK
jgi:hypothetical protein